MSDTNLVKHYINEKDFEIIAPELLKISYEEFCEIILNDGFIKHHNFLSSLKDAITLRKFFLDIEKPNLKHKDYLIVLEIVLFISLIEGYAFSRKYEKIESYLSKNFTDGMTKKQLKKLLQDYTTTYSLSAKVREFLKNGPFFDQLFLSACVNQHDDLKVKKDSLTLLGIMIEKHSLIITEFQYKKATSQLTMLQKVRDFVSDKKQKIPLKELHDCFKIIDQNNDLLKSTKNIANKLYDIRSKFMHTNEKKRDYSFFLDLEKGNIFDFNDIDFFRYFLRTLLLKHGFEINVLSIASKQPQ